MKKSSAASHRVMYGVIPPHQSWRPFAVRLGIGALVLVLATACGGSSQTSSLQGYCQQLQSDWPTLTEASGRATAVWMDAQTPGAIESQVALELQPDAALYSHAASLTSSLASVAPTAVKNFATTENPQARFQAMATGFKEAAQDNPNDLGNLDTSGLDAVTTGCSFGNDGAPDGTVATEYSSN